MNQQVETRSATVIRGDEQQDSQPDPGEPRTVKRVGAKKKIQAIESLFDSGVDQLEKVAAEMSVESGKVNSWIEAYKEGGRQALRSDHVSSDAEIGAVLADLVEVVRGQVIEDFRGDI